MPLYFIGIVVPNKVDEQARQWKRFMLTNYGCKVALRSPAHITLVPPFNLQEQDQEMLLKSISAFASPQIPFGIELQNFSAFPPRVIFVNVHLSAPLKTMHENIEEYMIENYEIKKSNRPFHPHITIANRDLNKKDFFAAYEHFKKIDYRDTFVADHISLLRSYSDGWKVIFDAPMNIRRL